MKKKILILMFAFVMVFSLVGCGANDETINDGTTAETRQDEEKSSISDRNELDNAANDAKNGLKDTGDAIKDGVEGAGDAIRDGVDDMTGMDRDDRGTDNDKTNE